MPGLWPVAGPGPPPPLTLNVEAQWGVRAVGRPCKTSLLLPKYQVRLTPLEPPAYTDEKLQGLEVIICHDYFCMAELGLRFVVFDL